MIQITDVILIALFIEAIVNAIKPIWTGGDQRLTITEYVSMGMGILLAVACKINMLAYVVEIAYPAWVEYIFYVLTGIAIGRGTNFLYDLWNKLKEWQTMQALPGIAFDDVAELETGEAGLNMTEWPLELIIAFAEENGYKLPENMPVNEVDARAYLIAHMFGKNDTETVDVLEDKQPPEGGDVE